jgi:hypothetical protein
VEVELHVFLTPALEVSGQIHAPAVLHQGKGSPVPRRQEARWTPEPVRIQWRRGNSDLGRNRIPVVQHISSIY